MTGRQHPQSVFAAFGTTAPWNRAASVQPVPTPVAQPAQPVRAAVQPWQPATPPQPPPRHARSPQRRTAPPDAPLQPPGPTVRRIVCHCRDCNGLAIYTTAPASTPNATHRLIRDTHFPNSEHAILGAAQRAVYECTPPGTAAARAMKSRMRKKPATEV